MPKPAALRLIVSACKLTLPSPMLLALRPASRRLPPLLIDTVPPAITAPRGRSPELAR